MKKKLIATVMAATMAVTALTGCGSSSASSAKKDIKRYQQSHLAIR